MKKRERKGLKIPALPKLSKKQIIIGICAVAVIAVGVIKITSGKKDSPMSAEMNTDVVTRGDVEVAITGSASIEPNERYEIISMVSGDIIRSDYDVGDTVKEGDILYQFDTSSTDIGIEKSKLSLDQSEINYNSALKKESDLTVTAPCSGVVSGLGIKVGDDIKNGEKIIDINNSKVMKVVLPFNENQIGNIYIGADAEITSSANMSSMNGVVTDKAAVATPQQDGSKLYDVTIEFDNPGAIVEGQIVGGAINSMISPGYGKAEYSESGAASSEAEGTVAKIYCSNGDYVNKGDVIVTLKSDTVSDNIKNSSISYKNAQLSLREQQDKLDDYKITSPISGTVITKNSKAGDTIDKTNSTQTLMVVADISKLKFDLAIDELDVSKVSQGQQVEITCDALPGEIYSGEITNLSVEGSASNGVTTYTAEVTVYEPGNLRPSMNVDASVLVEKAENVLRVPTSDIKTAMGRSFVFVKDESAANAKPEEKPQDGEKDKNKGGEHTEERDRDDKPTEDNAPEENSEKAPGGKGAALPEAPAGFRTAEVTIGVSGDDFTEIKSGLSEGDIIYSQTVSTSNSDNPFGGMGGGMPGGGGMSGGMGGGAPGGGGMGGGAPGGR